MRRRHTYNRQFDFAAIDFHTLKIIYRQRHRCDDVIYSIIKSASQQRNVINYFEKMFFAVLQEIQKLYMIFCVDNFEFN